MCCPHPKTWAPHRTLRTPHSVTQAQYARDCVANSFQHFPARMVAKNFGRWAKKLCPVVKIPFCQNKTKFWSHTCKEISKNSRYSMLSYGKNKGNKKTKFWSHTRTEICENSRFSLFKNSAPFRPFLGNSGQNSAADLSCRSYFYSALFEFCGRRIGQLGTLARVSRCTEIFRPRAQSFHHLVGVCKSFSHIFFRPDF